MAKANPFAKATTAKTKVKLDLEPKDAKKDKALGIKENSKKDEKIDAKSMKAKTPTKEPMKFKAPAFKSKK